MFPACSVVWGYCPNPRSAAVLLFVAGATRQPYNFAVRDAVLRAFRRAVPFCFSLPKVLVVFSNPFKCIKIKKIHIAHIFSCNLPRGVWHDVVIKKCSKKCTAYFYFFRALFL